jgi:hypothetical protein
MTTRTPTERTQQHNAKRKAQGWRFINVQLPPDAVKLLADIEVHEKDRTTAEIICRAIAMYRNEARY